MSRSEEIYMSAFDSPKGRRLEAVIEACDHCGKPLTKEELALVDVALPPIAPSLLLITECAACTADRDCSDEEYFTDLMTVADDALARARKQ